MSFLLLIPRLFTACLACKLYFHGSIWEFYPVIGAHNYQQVSVWDDNLGLAVERQLLKVPVCSSSGPQSLMRLMHIQSPGLVLLPPICCFMRVVFQTSCALEWFPCRCHVYQNERKPSMHAVFALIVLRSNRCFQFFMRLSADGRVPANREEANNYLLHYLMTVDSTPSLSVLFIIKYTRKGGSG